MVRCDEKLKKFMINIRRELHKNAEIGFDIPKTFAIVKTELEKMGLTIRKCGKSGIICDIKGEKEGKTVLLRADMDALPIKEETQCSFSSKNGNMHACGHDMHTAMLLGAAFLLKDAKKDICGTVRLMFQPAEEILMGANDMINDGALEGVDGAVMLHTMTNTPFETGTVIVPNSGVCAPAADYFEIEVLGKGSHGAMPDSSIDPINAASHIVTALQTIHSREISMFDKAVLTIGSFNAGNGANVIPDKAVLKGTLRAFDENCRQKIKKRMEEISKHTTAAFNARARVNFYSGCPALINNAELINSAKKLLPQIVGEEKTLLQKDLEKENRDNRHRAAGSEDFSFVSQKVPSIILTIAAGKKEEGFEFPLHHPKVQFDEEALNIGCEVYANLALNLLCSI